MVATKNDAVWTSSVYEQGSTETPWKEYQGELTFVPKEVSNTNETGADINNVLAKYADNSVEKIDAIKMNATLSSSKKLNSFTYDYQDILFFPEDKITENVTFTTVVDNGQKFVICTDTATYVYEIATPYMVNSGITFIESWAYYSISYLKFTPDGLTVVSSSGGVVRRHTLSSPYSLSDASFVWDVTLDSYKRIKYISDDGLHIMCNYKYTAYHWYHYTSSTSVFDATSDPSFSSASDAYLYYIQNCYLDSTGSYFVGSDGTDIKKFEFGTAYDLSTLTQEDEIPIPFLYISSDYDSCVFTADNYVYFSFPQGTIQFEMGNFSDLSTLVARGLNGVKGDYASSSSWGISSDGKTILNTVANDLYIYTSSTPYDFSSSVTSRIETPPNRLYSPHISNDGLVAHGTDGASIVYQYRLTVPYDFTTATEDTTLTTSDTSILGLAFSADGTWLYVSGNSEDKIEYCTLSTPYDLTTASTFSVYDPSMSYPRHMVFSVTGNYLYITTSHGTTTEFSLHTSWDLSTASKTGVTGKTIGEHVIGTQLDNLTLQYTQSAAVFVNCELNADGAYIADTTATTLYEAAVPSMFVLLGSTEAITSMVDQEMVNLGSTDGEVLLDFDNNVDRIFTQYDSVKYSVVDNYNLATASYTGNSIDIGTQDTYAKGVTLSPDGTKMFVAGEGNHSVYRYDLSTAWDVGTAVYLNSYSVTDEESYVRGVVFSTAGDAMYIVGTSSDKVHKYTLGTAWDLTTVSYSNEYVAVGTEDGHPSSLAFSSDGTKLFVLGYDNDAVFTYDMTAAWDLTTASYSSASFSVTTEESSPLGLAFNSDGTKMYTVGTSASAVVEYVLGTAWDVATATASGVTFSISEQAQNAEVFFGDDGTKMYVVGYDTNLVCEYDVGTATYGLSAQIDSIEVASGQTKLLFTEDITAYSVTVDGRSAATAYASYEGVSGNIKATTGVSVENVGKRFAQVRVIGDDTDEVVSAKLNMWKE